MISLHAIGAVLAVSLISLIGIALFSLSEKMIRSCLVYTVSLAAGVLIGDVFLHIIPELAEEAGLTSRSIYGIIGGILFSFVIEKIIHWHHCHILPSKEHYHPVGILALVGDGIHNFVDGALIAGSFLVSPSLGAATTIAIALHEIPQEISDFALLLYSGFTRKAALGFNILSSFTALAGACIVLLSNATYPKLSSTLAAFAAGNFLYIAGADLIPELHKQAHWKSALLQLFFICSGIGLMQALTVLE